LWLTQHTLHVQDSNSMEYTGPMSSIFFTICDPDRNDDDGDNASCINVEETCASI